MFDCSSSLLVFSPLPGKEITCGKDESVATWIPMDLTEQRKRVNM
jgi:hypothetical protein